MIGKIKIDGQLLKSVGKYEISNEPLWAKDAGRNNMSGTFTGTFNGWYPTITITFNNMHPADMAYNATIIEKPILSITYEDYRTGQMQTRDFYGTAIRSSVPFYKGYYENFSVSFVSVKKL